MQLRKGVCYLIEDATSELAYRLFTELLSTNGSGFSISRRHPAKLRSRFGGADVRIGWLAESPGEDHFSANAMGFLAKTIQQFIAEHGSSGIVLIDGLEYVIIHNGFQPTLLAFVEHLNEFIMGTQAIVLIAFRPETVDPRELALLERNLRVLDGKDVKAQLDIEELGKLLGERMEGTRTPLSLSSPKGLNPEPGMSGLRVDSVRCPKCGTENKAEVAFCVYCGAPLPEGSEEIHARTPVAASFESIATAVKPIPPSARERHPDFVGLIGIAFFLLIVGVVFTLNTNLLNDFRDWWDRILENGIFARQPAGIIASGVLFFALLGLSNFLTSGLRWILDRNRFGALARILAGIGFLAFAFLLTRYSAEATSGQLVISVWATILGTLLVVYIAIGLYWTTTRRRPAVETTREARSP